MKKFLLGLLNFFGFVSPYILTGVLTCIFLVIVTEKLVNQVKSLKSEVEEIESNQMICMLLNSLDEALAVQILLLRLN